VIIPMPSYRLSPLAEADLFKIISSTVESWGSTQAKVYAQTIDADLQRLE
jgi:toxin ParE1/3/4